MVALPRPRRRNSRPLVAAVGFLIIIGLVTVSWIVLKEFQVQQSVYARILDEKLTLTRNQFRLFLNPFSLHLETMVQWSESGLLEVADGDVLKNLVVPLLDQTDQVAGAYFQTDAGVTLALIRGSQGWEVMSPVALDSLTSAYLAQVARQKTEDEAIWSRYLPLPGQDTPGLIISRKAGPLLISLGLSEADLDLFTARTPITENGFLIRRFETGQVAWLTPKTGNRLDITDSGELLTSNRPELNIISEALRQWGARDRPYHMPFQFAAESQTWWCSFYPAEQGSDPGEMGLIAPAADLSKRLETVTGRVTLLLAGLLALAMTVVVAVAFDYRNKWRRFARRRLQTPPNEATLAALVAAGESDILEFKSTLRWNLYADKAGKEIELAWLKTVVGYLNSAGGFLLIGVQDDGQVLGIEADKFANEDKLILHFDNLIKQHIGLEHAVHLHASVRDLEGRRVFLIQCDRGHDPAYLKSGDKEAFYIRTGASTHKLPISKINDYLRDRER